jgi:hypothetical protein
VDNIRWKKIPVRSDAYFPEWKPAFIEVQDDESYLFAVFPGNGLTTHNAGDPRVFPRKRMVYTRSANAEFFFHVLLKAFFVVLINVSCAFMACCHILG